MGKYVGSAKFHQEATEVANRLADVLVNGAEKSLPAQEARLIPNTIALQNLPVGAKIQDPKTKYYGAAITWLIADHDYYGGSLTTLVSERILAFKPFDAAEPNNLNDWQVNYGSNDYDVSNIAQWLNSNEGNWFKHLHIYDAPPTEEHVSSRPYAEESGFLTNFSEEFIQNLNDTVIGKVFLLSDEEVGLSDGERLKLFENEEYRKAKPTKECVQIDGGGDENEPDWWWLRTPESDSSHDVRGVYSLGAIGSSYAWSGIGGVRPALNLSSEIRVKAKPNENGVYEIVWV